MKLLKCSLLTLVYLMILCLFSDQARGQDEVRYLGELCGSAMVNDFSNQPPNPMICEFKLGVLAYGDGHFSLDGTYGYYRSDQFPIHGTAMINDDNEIIMSLFSAGSYGDVFVIHARLDPNLEGNCTMTGFHYDDNDPYGCSAVQLAGGIGFEACP